MNRFSSHEMRLSEMPKHKKEPSTDKRDGTCRVQGDCFSGLEMTMLEKKRESECY